MYQEKPRRTERMPSRVTAIKWLGVLQLIHGILIFIVSVVLFAIDFESAKVAGTFVPWTTHGFLLAFFALGSGSVGASMSRYEGLVHNISSKQAHLALSVMNAFASIWYMVVVGTHYFYTVDEVITLGAMGASWKGAFAMIVIMFILSFFNMLVSFMSVILCALWIPRESGMQQQQASPYPSERYVEEPYVVREERMPYSRSHIGAYGARGASNYPYDYYNGGYRTLPALKY